jgi:carbonic anhydrase/acetyltransferase-like protein (isoleucine patch superfamily)
MGPSLRAAELRAICAWDRLRLRWLRWRHPGLEVHPEASSNFACARFNLAPGSRLRLGAGAVTERIPGRLHFILWPGAEVDVQEDAWLRTEVGETVIVAFEGARMVISRQAFLNGCHVSAKKSVTLGHKASVGVGSRVFDSDQHDMDDTHLEEVAPVVIGNHAWVAADCMILKGVTIGEHSVIGAHSVVTADIPPHTLAFGSPARPRGSVGDRSKAR